MVSVVTAARPDARRRGKSTKSMELIQASYDILAQIQPATVRAVCYRLFVLGLIPSMHVRETQRVSTQLVDAREDGTIPWEWIVDETRKPERISQWSNPAEYAETVQYSYRRDRWSEQPRLLEVWSEKGTVRGTLAPVLQRYAVTFRVFRGFASATAVNDVAVETNGEFDAGGAPRRLALYVGDWDPSGLCMSERDLPERLERYDGDVEIRRVALEESDTHAGLPGFALESKRADSRYQWFLDKYGTRCWELDALNPNVLRDRIETAIHAELDIEAWDRAARIETIERESLVSILGDWKAARG
jgi:hypothetical protein